MKTVASLPELLPLSPSPGRNGLVLSFYQALNSVLESNASYSEAGNVLLFLSLWLLSSFFSWPRDQIYCSDPSHLRTVICLSPRYPLPFPGRFTRILHREAGCELGSSVSSLSAR